MWGYYDAYTSAQIELMAADCPLTVYDRSKNGKGEKNVFRRADVSDVLETAGKWRQKYGKGDGDVTVDLGGFKMIDH